MHQTLISPTSNFCVSTWFMWFFIGSASCVTPRPTKSIHKLHYGCMVDRTKIRLLSKDTSFLPSGSDISDTCFRLFHLHESHAYYIPPTCSPPRELSSSVAGNNSKLLLLVMCHPASAIIYVHRTIVFWPRGYFVCLRFQLYDATTRAESLHQCQVNPSLAHSRKVFSKLMFPPFFPPQIESLNCRGKCVAFLNSEGYVRTRWKESDQDGLHLRGAHQEGHVPHYSCLERGLASQAHSCVR